MLSAQFIMKNVQKELVLFKKKKKAITAPLILGLQIQGWI